ncbi:unnamed protein product [Boreogadus saida]
MGVCECSKEDLRPAGPSPKASWAVPLSLLRSLSEARQMEEWPSVRLSTKGTRTICKDFRRTLTGDLLRALLDRCRLLLTAAD